MRKICVINQKGGVAKTTTAVNLGAGLALEGRKVLIVDLDPQSNVESCLHAESKKNIYDLLMEGADVGECITHLGTDLDIIKSDEALTDAEMALAKEKNPTLVLKQKLEKVSGYDYIILDCPPSLGLLSTNAMRFAGEAVIPVSTDVLGLEALNKMVKVIQTLNYNHEHDLQISKIVPTMHDTRLKLSKQVLSVMQNEYYELVADPVRLNSKVKEAPRAKKSIFKYARSSMGAKDYRALVNNIMRDELKYGLVIGEADQSEEQAEAIHA